MVALGKVALSQGISMNCVGGIVQTPAVRQFGPSFVGISRLRPTGKAWDILDLWLRVLVRRYNESG